MSNVPPGWAEATLADVARWGSGGTPKAGDSRYYGGAIPWAVIGDLNDGVVSSTTSKITDMGLAESSAKLVPEGAILIAMYGSIGKLGIAGTPMATNQAIAFALPCENVINPRYLFWYLRFQREDFNNAGKGATQKNISQTVIKSWPIPIPPLPEQRRIVATLENHLSRLDAGKEGVTNSAKRSHRLWSSVLNAVHSGSLVGELGDVEKRTISEIAAVQGGIQKQQRRKPVKNKFPFLRVANVPRGSLNLSEVHEVELFDGELDRLRLHFGDLLVVEGNGSPDQIGRAAMWKDEILDCVHQNHLIRVRPGPDLDPNFLELVWNAPKTAVQLRHMASSTSGLHTLSTAKVKSIFIPVPSLHIQRKLVEEAQRWRSHINAAEQSIHDSRKRSDALRRSLLSQAFTGRLVPQDPEGEPASVLLERIKAEWAAVPTTRRRGSRTGSKTAGTVGGRRTESMNMQEQETVA